MLLIEGAEYTIPEARRAAEAPEADGEEEAPLPEGDWTGPDYWYSPYGLTAARDDDRGHSTQQQRDQAGPTLQRASDLLRLDLDPEDRHNGGERSFLNADEQSPGLLAQILTPQGADVLAVAADNVAERGWHHLFWLGDRVGTSSVPS
jgi:hypothetical protein